MKKRIIAVVMMVVMLMSAMGSMAYAADEAVVSGDFQEINGHVNFVLSVSGDVTEFEYVVEVGDGVVDPGCGLTCNLADEMTDFADANDGIVQCGELATSKFVFGGVFAEEQSYTGAIGMVKVSSVIENGTVVTVYSNDEKVGEYTYSKGLLGDVDGNEAVEAADALLTLKAVVKLETLDDTQFKCADVDGNDSVEAADALLILKKVVKLIDKFPAEEA